MVLLVPRQLQRAGMTGAVPYYGGRLSPAQAYAVSHQPRPPEAPVTEESRPQDTAGTLETLQGLLDDGVITEDEYRTLRARVVQ